MSTIEVPVRPDRAALLASTALADLSRFANWVLWKAEPKPGGKINKIPKRVASGGKLNADVSRRATQTTLAAAIQAYDPAEHGGVGFVFHKEEGLAGFDLDGCRNPETGEIAAWAQPLIEEANTLTEISPSGTGVKLIGRGSVPKGRKVGAIEAYDDGRFFTITGCRLEGTPDALNDIGAFLRDTLWPLLDEMEAKRGKRGNGAAGEAVLVDLGDGSVKIEGKLKRLLANPNGKFARSWRHARDDLKDQSLSSYDLSLCTIGAAKGWTDAELASLIAAHRTAHDDTSGKGHRKDYLIRTIASARAAAARMAAEEEARATKPIELVGEVGRGRITVPYRGEDLPEVVDAVQTVVLADRGAEPVFVYADRLVTVRRASPKTVHQLADRANDCPPMPMVFTYCAVALRERIARSVVIETWHARAKEWRAGICPREVAETLLKRAGAGAPPLTGVIETPTLRPDGSLLLTPGYDPATGLFGGFRPSDWRGLKTDPTQADAKAALAYLTDTVLAEFPFATGVDKAVAVAMICTGLVCRTLRGGVPLFGTSAPERATGKTALAELVAHSITGRPAAAASFSADEAEMRKLLTSVLREGHGVVCFDELPAGEPVDSGTLAKVATSSLHQDRMLGGNETGTFPTNALFILTGNNLTLAQNLASRTLTVYLDTDSEEPEKRAFKRDLTTWPDEHRVEVVSAALTVMRAYAVAGHPKPKRSESRFKGWDRTVRDALLWLGMPDPAIKFDEAKTEDPEREKRANLLAELTAAFPPGETHHFQASAVSARAGTNDPLAGALKQFQPCWRTIDPRAVGLVFRSLRNVWIGDMKLVDVIKATKKHPASWAILVKDKGTKA